MKFNSIPKLNLSDLLSGNKQSIRLLSEALSDHGFFIIYNHKIDLQLLRGVKTDELEQIYKNLPFAEIKYGEAQVKFICTKS